MAEYNLKVYINMDQLKIRARYIIMIKQNYLVYIKTQDNDPIDLIAVDRGTGEVLKLDVKSVSIRKTGPKKGYRISRIVNEHQKKIGVKLLYVYDDGRCDFHGKD